MSNQPTNPAEAVNEASVVYHLRIDKEARHDETARRVDKQSAFTGGVNDSVDALALIHPTAYEQYAKLSAAEIKTLVIADKWLTHLSAAVQGELDRVSQTLTYRIRQLAERYATPLPQLEDEVAALAACVEEHLKSMGASWR